MVSGAIDFVKELEQQLQSLEAQKLALKRQLQQQQQLSVTAAIRDDAAQPAPGRDDIGAGAGAGGDAAARSEVSAPEPDPPPFARFFRYPQYARRHAAAREDAGAGAGAEETSRASAVADVEVGVVVDAHASLRVMAPRRPGQLLRMVAGMQALGLAVLHLNVATAAVDATALYTLSLKVRTTSTLDTRFVMSIA